MIIPSPPVILSLRKQFSFWSRAAAKLQNVIGNYKHIYQNRMTFRKKISPDNELLLYKNGKLIYKRWLNLGYSKVFDVTAYDKKTFISITEENGLIKRKKRIFINGYSCHSQLDFWNKFSEQLDTQNSMNFGKNLDAFSDAITGGGPGCPGDSIIEIVGTKQLEKIFGVENFNFIIELLKNENYIDLILEK